MFRFISEAVQHPFFIVVESAGVGRSGTFIALDTLLHQILADHDLDVYGVVFQMRMNRVLMVQTEVSVSSMLSF